MARTRSAPSTQQPAPPSATAPSAQTSKPRQALKEKTNTTRAKAPIYSDDGNTEDLIKDARPRRGRFAKVASRTQDDYTMAGGLGAASDDKNVERSEPILPTTDELAKSDGRPPPAAKGNRRPPRATKKPVQNEAQSKVLDGLKKRMQATARPKAGAPRKQDTHIDTDTIESSLRRQPAQAEAQQTSGNAGHERSEFSLSPSPPPSAQINSVVKQRTSFARPGSALKAHGTPSVETSMLALKNFKRRPRQPSMLQMVQQRTASARPSAAFRQAEDTAVFDVDNASDDDEDDFAPDAEGTPARVGKRTQQPPAEQGQKTSGQRTASPAQQHSSRNGTSRKRKSIDDGEPPSTLGALRAKRPRPSAVEVEDELPAGFPTTSSVRRSSPQREESSPLKGYPEVQVINSSPESTPPTEHSSPNNQDQDKEFENAIPSTELGQHELPLTGPESPRRNEEVTVNGTMAEPLSSSPPPELPFATQQTDIMAEPLTQISPPRRPKRDYKKQKKKKAPAPMTTAALQSLLPKRRQPLKPRHRKSEYDFDQESSDNEQPLDPTALSENEDELGANLRGRSKTKPISTRRKTKAKPKTTKKPKAAPARKSTAAKTKKTYGRAQTTASDKENDAGFEEGNDSLLPDTSMSMYEAAQSKELEAARKKFAAVDEWDMEFESVSFGEHRSSSQGWR
jgi:hypothetical protein